MLASHISEDIGRGLNNIRLALVSRLPIVNLSVCKHNIHFPKIKNVFLTLIFYLNWIACEVHAAQKILLPQITRG